MLTFNLLPMALFALIYLFISVKLYKKKKPFEQYILFAIFLIYIAGLVNEVFFPIPMYSEDINFYRQYSNGIEYNIIPFKTIIAIFVDRHFSIIQTGGNILLFIPMGYFLPLICSKFDKLYRIMITTFGISLGIELIQLTASLLYKFTYKRFDADDIILNVLGSLIGYTLLKLTTPILKKYTALR